MNLNKPQIVYLVAQVNHKYRDVKYTQGNKSYLIIYNDIRFGLTDKSLQCILRCK